MRYKWKSTKFLKKVGAWGGPASALVRIQKPLTANKEATGLSVEPKVPLQFANSLRYWRMRGQILRQPRSVRGHLTQPVQCIY
jgi:hypothetical protein